MRRATSRYPAKVAAIPDSLPLPTSGTASGGCGTTYAATSDMTASFVRCCVASIVPRMPAARTASPRQRPSIRAQTLSANRLRARDQTHDEGNLLAYPQVARIHALSVFRKSSHRGGWRTGRVLAGRRRLADRARGERRQDGAQQTKTDKNGWRTRRSEREKASRVATKSRCAPRGSTCGS